MQTIDVQLKEALQKAIKKAFDLELDVKEIQIEIPKNKEHGDFSSNAAMQLTKILRKNPRLIAQEIVQNVDQETLSNSCVLLYGT